MELLAFYEQTHVFAKYYLELGKHYMRQWLGPEPQNYYIMYDGQVLPSTIQLNEVADSYIYDSSSNRISLIRNPMPEGRFRPLHYISIRIESKVGNIDISDWLGEIRANPVPNLSLKQILLLWSLTQNTYVPFDGTTHVFATKNNGDEETIVF